MLKRLCGEIGGGAELRLAQATRQWAEGGGRICDEHGFTDGYSRRTFMVPIPRFATWDAFNDCLEDQCRKRQADVLWGQSETIGQCLARDLAAMSELPAAPFDACDQATGRVNSPALVRYKTNDYSVPVAYGHRDVWIRGIMPEACLRHGVDDVVIGCGGEGQPQCLHQFETRGERSTSPLL